MIKELFIASAIFATGSVEAETVKNSYISLNLDHNRTYTLKGLKDNKAGVKAEFNIYDGKSKKYMALPQPVITKHKSGILVKYQNNHLVWNLQFTPLKKLILIKSSIKNTGKNELWLEPGIKLKLQNISDAKKCWTGFSHTLPFGEKAYSRKGIKGSTEKHTGASTRPFPVTAVFTKKSAIFAGGVPFEPVSYNASFIGKKKNNTSSISYSIRNAILPGKTVNLSYVIGIVPSSFGGQEAVVQAYYDSMPELWRPVVGQDNPYIWGAHGQYLLWWKKPDYEVARRMYVTNEWTYCAYRRSGDIKARRELWDYKPLGQERKTYLMCGTNFKYKDLSWGKYIEMRRNLFRKYAKSFGLMFYNSVIGTWCEAQLAKKKYPDAIVNDKSVPYYLKSWSTSHDHEVRVFPMGTSFAKVFKEDMAYVAKDLDLPGFAFDCAYGGAYYRGPATKKDIPGRAWDSDGVFIDQSVAINHIADFTHDIIKSKDPSKKLVVFSNGYLKGDYIMVEEQLLGVAQYKRWMPLLRYHIGSRPAVSHGHGFTLHKIITNWREKSTEEFNEFMPKLADYIIFNEFKYALTTTHLTQFGNPQITYCMPEVIEMMRAGWQAEIPLSYDNKGKKVYEGRYGRGTGTYFFIGNPYNEAMPLELKIANSHLGDATYLFIRKMRRSACGKNVVKQGKTIINVNLQSRTPYLYEAVCGLSSVSNDSVYTLQSQKDINRQVYTVKIEAGAPVESRIISRKLRNFKLNSLKLNGKSIAFSASNDKYESAKADLKAGSVIKLEYISKIYKITQAELLKFPFVDSGNKVNFTITIPAKASKEGLEAATMLREYFAFCAKHKVINKNSREVEILKTDKIPAKGNIIAINSKNAPTGLSMPSSRVIMLKSDRIISQVKDMEYIMDKRFKYIMPFAPVMGLYSNQIKHFNLYGKHMPYKEYFETNK